MRSPRAALWLALAAGCAPARPERPVAPEPAVDPVAVERPRPVFPEPAVDEPLDRIAPPEVAYAHGWMALGSTGADRFLQAHPAFDGRGVLIAVLDTGVDPSIPGLATTSTGDPKLLDFRDFSDEGSIPLEPIAPAGDTVRIEGRALRGFGRVKALNAAGPWYAGSIAELPLGEPPAADLNGNGTVGDTLAVVVTRASDGWVLLADTDGDGSFAGERPVRDYLTGRQWFGWAARGRTPRIAVAANFAETDGVPRLGLAFDLSSHGSHVAGIAAAHDLYGVAGFSGVAPGAQLLGLKISNSAQGSVSTTGAMLRAIEYAIRFAERRRLGLVLNLSFGVGNEIEGSARIDQLIDSVLARHPSVVLTVSAGNDGPGLSTIGFPGSTDRAITVGATLPPAFLPPSQGGGPAERVAYFSSRGGELAKPDLVAPGVAYSSVPRYDAGDEVKQGTSMASPHVAGLAALLLSALRQERRPIEAARIRQALMVTARPSEGAGFVDEGQGLPQVDAAHRWLLEDRPVEAVHVRVGGTSRTAAWIVHRPGAAADSVVRFELRRSDSSATPASYTLRSGAPWLRAPARATLPRGAGQVSLSWSPGMLERHGVYQGAVSGWTGDTLAGPAFRLVVTVVVPARAAGDSLLLRSGAPVASGSVLRSFFLADTARPFEVRIAVAGRSQGLAFLHEPDGVPYRDGHALPAGGEPATFRVDGRDVRAGAYEVDVIPAPGRRIDATVGLRQAPYRMGAARSAGGIVASLTGIGRRSEAELRVGLVGGERVEEVLARGSAARRIPLTLPAWATAVVVDVTMDRDQWSRFTDFGLTLFDAAGRQLGKDPLEYAFGRLRVDLPRGQADRGAEVALYPGFADPADERDWSARVSIRLYADSMAALEPAAADAGALVVPAGRTVTRRYPAPASPWPLGAGFFPLAVLVARTSEHIWTREVGLPPSATGSVQR